MIAQEAGLTLEDVRWLADVLHPDQAASYKQDFAEYYWLGAEVDQMLRVHKLLFAENSAKAEKRAGLEPQPTVESEPEIARLLVKLYREMLETQGKEIDILFKQYVQEKGRFGSLVQQVLEVRRLQKAYLVIRDGMSQSYMERAERALDKTLLALAAYLRGEADYE
jgi:hypothetical protein